MPLKRRYRVAVHVIFHDRISDAVELHVGLVDRLEILIRFLDPEHLERIHMLSIYRSLFGKLKRCRRIDRLEHTSRGRDTDFMKLFADYRFKIVLDIPDRISDLLDIMYLPVKHRARLMLPVALCHNVKSIIGPVPDRADNTPCPDIQSEYELSRILLTVSHFYTSLIL